MLKHEVITKGFFNKPSDRFLNRELSWLEFNYRVLEEARNIHNPLLERIKFLSISSSNLDEFYMVRVAGLMDQTRNDNEKRSIDGATAAEQLAKVKEKSRQLISDQQACWSPLRGELSRAGIYIESAENLNVHDIAQLHSFFLKDIFPALSPIAIGTAHPFPFLPNLGLAVIVQLNEKHSNQYAITILPSKLDRFIKIPGKKERYILLEELIKLFQHDLFPGKNITGFGIAHITRDSDIEIEEDAEDLMSHFESAVKMRRRGSVILLKLKIYYNQELYDFIKSGLEITDTDIITVDKIINLSDISEFYKYGKPKLKYKPYKERLPERFSDFSNDYFAAISAKDIVIHHPYETFDVVVNFLNQAAAHPDVVAIKQTLYRTSSDSPVVKALIRAAEAGKSVTVVVELQARFDEESNIRWAKDLERAGAQVVFGFVNIKTHAKISLVVIRENEHLKSYVHFGTGNYHPITARTYADLSLFTCDPELCNDAAYLFNYLTGYSSPNHFEKLIVSPINMNRSLLKLIETETENAKNGKPAFIWAKMNSLIASDIIDALYLASQAGVSIDLVIRGICGLKPGIKGFSDNIRVKSIVGRYLEHARIFCFGDGHLLPSDKSKLFISSADWMPRNLIRRVEIMVPIKNPTVHQQIMEQIMIANLKDRQQSWYLQADGQYIRCEYTPNAFCAHDYFMRNPSLSGRGKSLTQAQLNKQRKKIYRLFPFIKDKKQR